jgi:Protein of unknown function (DUF3631)
VLDIARTDLERCQQPRELRCADRLPPLPVFRPWAVLHVVQYSDDVLAEHRSTVGCQKHWSKVIRAVGDDYEPRVFSCHCPVAIAAIGRLPDTVEDRSVAVTLQRRRKDEPVTRLRLGQLALLAPIASKAQRWADDHSMALETADPKIPDALNDRAADCWRILLAIAERAGPDLG